MGDVRWKTGPAVVLLLLVGCSTPRTGSALPRNVSGPGELPGVQAVSDDAASDATGATGTAPRLIAGGPALPSAALASASGRGGWRMQEAQEAASRGTDLARRRAYFAARRQLLLALRLNLEGLDHQEQSRARTADLENSLRALAEAEELVNAGGFDPDDRDGLSSTAVVSVREVQRRDESLERCLFCAEEQLKRAARGATGVCETLRGLARIHEMLAEQEAVNAQLGQRKAVVFYRAALAANPQDAQVANDLGVLLARLGSLEEAQSALAVSATIKVEPVALHNLAVVYQQLGQTESAQRAYQESKSASPAAPEELPHPTVRWVDPATLARFSDEPWIAPSGTWNAYGPGEYVGPARMPHVAQYRLRVDDQMDMVYRQTRKVTAKPYRLTPGDEIRVQSVSRPNDINSERIIIQPDGMISLRLIGQVPAAGHTIAQLTEAMEERYQKYFPAPTIAITPLRLNSRVLDLIDAVDRRYGAGGGQGRFAIITPDGMVALPDVGSVPAQGLTLPELEAELNERYHEKIEGVFVNPVLTRRASRYVYVLGEVRSPGRYELLAPTTASQAIALAGSWNMGANLRQIVVLRRDDRWELMGCVINLNDVLYRGKRCPRDDIWISDSDVVIVPKGELLKANDLIHQVFTRGIYGVFPVITSLNHDL